MGGRKSQTPWIHAPHAPGQGEEEGQQSGDECGGMFVVIRRANSILTVQNVAEHMQVWRHVFSDVQWIVEAKSRSATQSNQYCLKISSYQQPLEDTTGRTDMER